MDDVVYVSTITFAAVEIAKQAGLPSRFAGLAALVIALAVAPLNGLYQTGSLVDWPVFLMTGVLGGLMAAGVYSAPKAALKKGQ